MILLSNTGVDKLQLVTSAATTIDLTASYVDLAAGGTGSPTPGRQLTAITTATTTDIVATPGSGLVRNVKELSIRNKHATLSGDVTVVYDNNGTDYEVHKTTLAAGEAVEYIEGVGWFKIGNTQVTTAFNASVAAQTPAAATLTQLAGSSIFMPRLMRINNFFQWQFDITKTGAGTASSAYHVRVGTANSTADAAILTFTKIAGTGVVDTGLITITALVRGPLTASCIMAGNFGMVHNLAATGHSTLPDAALNVVSSAFDATVANLWVSLSCTTGASDAITTQLMVAQASNL